MLADVRKSVWSLTTAVQNSFPWKFPFCIWGGGQGGRASRQARKECRLSTLFWNCFVSLKSQCFRDIVHAGRCHKWVCFVPDVWHQDVRLRLYTLCCHVNTQTHTHTHACVHTHTDTCVCAHTPLPRWKERERSNSKQNKSGLQEASLSIILIFSINRC